MTVVNKVKLDVIALRRQRVKSLRERGLNLDEITQALAREIDDGGMRNADTGEPFERSTIARDLQWLRTRDFD
jgi:DNA-binding transcriptional MerR regulator